MTSPAGTTRVTVEEFYRLVPDGQKADLIDGVIYMASPESRQANKLVGFIYSLLERYLEACGIAGELFFSRYACRLGPYRAPEPDVLYVRPERAALAEEGGLRGAPDIAVEVVCDESRQRDYHDKRRLYAEAGVPEYWIVDPEEDRVEFLLLAEGRYEPAALDDGRIFRSRVLPGLWIDTAWLLADPPPPATACLQAMLSEPRS